MDNNLTIKMKMWLEQESHTETDDIMQGALMLLQLNRNQVMFQSIMRNPLRYVDKIKYELGKFLPMRLAQMTVDDVVQLDKEITPEIEVLIENESNSTEGEAIATGIRVDHDALPDEIKAIWEENAARWKKIKAVYNTCRTLEKPCDRFEHLTILKELWYTYKREMEKYDSFDMSSLTPVDGQETAGTGEEAEENQDVAAKVITARTYVSKNLAKLIELRKSSFGDSATPKDIEKYNALLAKIQERVDFLASVGKPVGDDVLAKLAEGGLDVIGKSE